MIFNKEVYKDVNVLSNKRIILCIDSFLPLDEYLLSIKNRYGGSFLSTPSLTISKKGDVYQHREMLSTNKCLLGSDLNEKSIIVSFENLGFIKKSVNNFVDWRSNQYDGEVFNKKWRGFDYWDQYTEEQFKTFNKVSNYLCNRYNINNDGIESNVYLKLNYKEVNGVFCLSNFKEHSVSLNPSFIFNQVLL